MAGAEDVADRLGKHDGARTIPGRMPKPAGHPPSDRTEGRDSGRDGAGPCDIDLGLVGPLWSPSDSLRSHLPADSRGHDKREAPVVATRRRPARTTPTPPRYDSGVRDPADPLVNQEYFESEPTGVELEDDGLEPTIVEPWDPDLIRVTSKNFAIRNITDMIRDHDLDLAPDFQRQRVWKPIQKSRLIESILLQIPLPAFYFTEEADGMMRVVDGLQRLSTIDDYVNGRLALDGLEYLQEVEGDRFGALAQTWQRRILHTQLFVHVIDPQTPDPVKFDIFKRINTGGSPLNAQEIRHCMSGDQSRTFLKEVVSTPEFQRATGGALANHVRMVDREVALRFFAFKMLGTIAEYRNYSTMDAFLTDATRRIDRASPILLDDLRSDFLLAMTNASVVFGDHAFRKWPADDSSDYRSPINRALFETWALGLSQHSSARLEATRSRIVALAREAMAHDALYIQSISGSTGDPFRVEVRFSKTFAILNEALA